MNTQPVPNMRIWCARCKDFRRYYEPTPGRYACVTYRCEIQRGFKPIKWLRPRSKLDERGSR